jgi:ankyrin repeat protein
VAAAILFAILTSSPAFCGPIHDAAKKGDIAAVQALLKQNPDLVSSKDENQNTPLYLAAWRGQTAIAELLLANGADLEARNAQGSTPLSIAAGSGRREMAELLLAHKAEVNVRNQWGETPLIKAAAEGYTEVVEVLLANKADVNARSESGQTPLIFAVAGGHLEVVEVLLANKADVNASGLNGMTPMHFACDRGLEEVARLLLLKGASLDIKDAKGITPVRMAEDADSKDVMELLDRWASDGLPAPREPAHASSSDGAGTLASGLRSPIHEAVRKGDLVKVRTLLTTNPRLLSSKDADGETPLQWAAISGSKRIAQMLLADRAEVNTVDDTGETPLHWASRNGHSDVAEVLLAYKARIDVIDHQGLTPSQWAAKNGNQDVANLLHLHGGADVSADLEMHAWNRALILNSPAGYLGFRKQFPKTDRLVISEGPLNVQVGQQFTLNGLVPTVLLEVNGAQAGDISLQEAVRWNLLAYKSAGGDNVSVEPRASFPNAKVIEIREKKKIVAVITN